MKFIFIASFLLSTFSVQANEAFHRTFVGHCYNYALATSYAEEYSYLLFFSSQDDVETYREDLQKFFTMEAHDGDLAYKITYRPELTDDQFFDGAFLVDTLLYASATRGDCVFATRN